MKRTYETPEITTVSPDYLDTMARVATPYGFRVACQWALEQLRAAPKPVGHWLELAAAAADEGRHALAAIYRNLAALAAMRQVSR